MKYKTDIGFGLISIEKKIHPDKPVPKVYQEKYKGKKTTQELST